MTDIWGIRNGAVQKRATRKNGWTKAKRLKFLNAYAATANTRWSVEQAGMKAPSLWALKRRDPEFAALVKEAEDEAVDRLKAEMLARSLRQIANEDNPAIEELSDAVPLPPFDEAMALQVLEALSRLERSSDRHTSARYKHFQRATQAETDAALMQKLDAMEARLKKKGR